MTATTDPPILYLDQNAWIALARGAWDKTKYPREHCALTTVIKMVRDQGFVAPLSFTNIYETAKVNDPMRRANLARVQALISGGQVFRGRRRLLMESLTDFLCVHFSLNRAPLEPSWYLSELWFESVSDYFSDSHGTEIPEATLAIIRSNPAKALFKYLAFGSETMRSEAVRNYSASAANLLARIEARRGLAAGENLAMRRRAYGANLVLDEIDFILKTAQTLGLNWTTIIDISSSVIRSLLDEVPVFNIERELSIRLEDQLRPISENDLRDMLAFTVVLPIATIMVAEKPFVNMARQSALEKRYGTKLLTSVFDLQDV